MTEVHEQWVKQEESAGTWQIIWIITFTLDVLKFMDWIENELPVNTRGHSFIHRSFQACFLLLRCWEYFYLNIDDVSCPCPLKGTDPRQSRKKGQHEQSLLKFCLVPVISRRNDIMVIIITIRANHGAFQSEHQPSLTCPSPQTAPKCPDYHHQGRTMCVCACVRLTPPTLNLTQLWAPQRSVECVRVCGDNRAAGRRVQRGPSWPVCQHQLTVSPQPMGWKAWLLNVGQPGLVCVSVQRVLGRWSQWPRVSGAFFHPGDEMENFSK